MNPKHAAALASERRCAAQEAELASHQILFSELEVTYRNVSWDQVPESVREDLLNILRRYVSDFTHRASVASSRKLPETEACDRFWIHVYEAAIARLKEP